MERGPTTGLRSEPFFAGMTRPAMYAKVPARAFGLNVFVHLMALLVTQLVWHSLLLALATFASGLFFYALLRLFTYYEPRFAEFFPMWASTRGADILSGALRFWRAGSYTPLAADLVDARGRRRSRPWVWL